MTTLERLLALGLRPRKKGSVEQLEAALGAAVPAPFRDLLALGGGAFERATYYFDPRAKGPVLLGWFLNAEESLQAYEAVAGSVERWLLPIANDGGDNLHCLAFRGPRKGQVFFHEHGVASLDPEDLEGPPTSASFVSDSFEALVDSLTQPEA